jgi:hypothetical protein
VTRFFDLLRNDPDPASPYGYNGVSFWSVQHHTPSIWLAVGNGTVSAPTGSISGSLFNDVDADGVRDPGEAPVAGRIVYDDTNGNFVRDGHEPFVTTASDGTFKLVDMAARTHTVRQEVPTGERQTSPADLQPNRVAVAVAQQVSGVAFGTTALGKVQGTVFDDKWGNGAKDPGTDTALRGWVVFADANHNAALDQGEIWTRSNRQGNYVLNLPAGSYDVRQIPSVAGVFRTTNPGLGYHPIDLFPGQALTKMFGNTTLTAISGFVYRDANRDGMKQGRETPLAGWRIFADLDGDGAWDANEDSALTDANGRYRLGTLAAGRYRIAVLQPKSWRATAPSPAVRRIALGSGGTTSNKNFGAIKIS